MRKYVQQIAICGGTYFKYQSALYILRGKSKMENKIFDDAMYLEEVMCHCSADYTAC